MRTTKKPSRASSKAAPTCSDFILFSARRRVSEMVEAWYAKYPQAERCTLNTVTAIHSLGLLKNPNSLICLNPGNDQNASSAHSTYLYPLFSHLSREHGLTLTDSEMAEIVRVVEGLEKGNEKLAILEADNE